MQSNYSNERKQISCFIFKTRQRLRLHIFIYLLYLLFFSFCWFLMMNIFCILLCCFTCITFTVIQSYVWLQLFEFSAFNQQEGTAGIFRVFFGGGGGWLGAPSSLFYSLSSNCILLVNYSEVRC